MDCRGYGTPSWRGPSHQPVRKCVSWQGEAENSLKADAFVVSEQFVRPESCQGDNFGKA